MKDFLKILNLLIMPLVGIVIGVSSIVVIDLHVKASALVVRDPRAAADLAKEDRFSEAGNCLFGSAAKGWDPSERYLLAGTLFLMARESDSAARSFELALQAGAPPADALVGSARAALQSGNDPSDLYRRAMTILPGDPWPAAEAALVLAAEGKRAEALDLLREAEDLRWVADPSIEAARALVHLSAGDWHEARRSIADGNPLQVKGGRGSGEFHFAAAVVALHDGSDSAARRHLEDADSELLSQRDALMRMVMPDSFLRVWTAANVHGRSALSRIEPKFGRLPSRRQMLVDLKFVKSEEIRDTRGN